MEQIVSSGIIDSYFGKLKENLSVDVAIVGGGPSGLIAAYYLAKAGKKVALYERNLAPGGGMWGGAMMFNEIVVQKDALHILQELQIEYKHYKDDYYTVDSVHATSGLTYQATKAGVRIFNCTSIEDVVFHNDKVSGLVINWGPVHRERMHVDPLMVMAKAVIDGTGHPCEIVKTVAGKNDIQIDTPTGSVMGERSLSVGEAESSTIENTKEVFPGLFVSGMAANGTSGSYRMGPIFGGMLRSGQKAAKLIVEKLSVEDEVLQAES